MNDQTDVLAALLKFADAWTACHSYPVPHTPGCDATTLAKSIERIARAERERWIDLADVPRLSDAERESLRERVVRNWAYEVDESTDDAVRDIADGVAIAVEEILAARLRGGE